MSTPTSAYAVEAKRYGVEQQINPYIALLNEIRWAAGHVYWLRMKVQEAPTDDSLLEEYRPWLNRYDKERDRLASICERAIKLGLAERLVRAEEQHAEMLARALMASIEALNLPAEYAAKVPGILRQQLLALDPVSV